MKCVVLLGFSTTGKSSLLGGLRKTHASSIDTIDSDKEIAKKDGGNIYRVFYNFYDADTGSTERALREVENREKEFVQTAGPQTKPLLLAAGPCLPSRANWDAFMNRVHPVCFYLEKPAQAVLEDLLKRRQRHQADPKIANVHGFGCWDNDVTTRFQDGEWVLLPEEEALENVVRHMDGVISFYKKYMTTCYGWDDRTEDDCRLKKAIAEALGVE